MVEPVEEHHLNTWEELDLIILRLTLSQYGDGRDGDTFDAILNEIPDCTGCLDKVIRGLAWAYARTLERRKDGKGEQWLIEEIAMRLAAPK